MNNWFNILLEFISDYTIVLVFILSLLSSFFVIFNLKNEKQTTRKKIEILIAILSIFILITTSLASYEENRKNEEHLSAAIETLLNTDSLIDKAERNNRMINDNLISSKDLSIKTNELSQNTLKIFDKLTDKDSYCYVDVNPFGYPVEYQQKIIFCIKHVGKFALENVSMTIQNTSKNFCLQHFYKTAREWAMIDNLTTTAKAFSIIYPGTEQIFDYDLDCNLEIPNDSSAFNYVTGAGQMKTNMFKTLCNEDYVTLQIQIFTPNKIIREIIIIENYSNIGKRKIRITVSSGNEALKEIVY